MIFKSKCFALKRYKLPFQARKNRKSTDENLWIFLFFKFFQNKRFTKSRIFTFLSVKGQLTKAKNKRAVTLKRKEKGKMIEIEVLEDGRLIHENSAVSDGNKFETIKFRFPFSWEGYTKTVVFKNSTGVYNVILDIASDLCYSYNECYIPHEVLTAEGFKVSVFGVKGDSIATSEEDEIVVKQSGYARGQSPADFTQTEYEQLLNIANDTKYIAQSVRDDADRGLFHGIRGQKGEKGDPGVSGVYVGSGDMPEGYNVQIDPDGNSVSVDFQYNPKSENAQSGTAVSEAISDAKDYTDQAILELKLSEKMELLKQAAVLAAHPVGSYYWSSDATSPEDLFGGEWEAVKDKFILAAGDSYTAGQTGGEAEHILTVDEMPGHSHNVVSSSDSLRLVLNQIGTGVGSYAYADRLGNGYYNAWITDVRGGDQAHNNMPPYEVAYCWKRIN